MPPSFPTPNGSAVEPLAVPLAKAPVALGMSRSSIYRHAQAGRLTLLKSGRTTLVDMASARALLASLPRAVIAGRL